MNTENNKQIQETLRTIIAQNKQAQIFDDEDLNLILFKLEKLYIAGYLMLSHIDNANIKKKFLKKIAYARKCLLVKDFNNLLISLKDVLFYTDIIFLAGKISYLNSNVYKQAIIQLIDHIKNTIKKPTHYPNLTTFLNDELMFHIQQKESEQTTFKKESDDLNIASKNETQKTTQNDLISSNSQNAKSVQQINLSYDKIEEKSQTNKVEKRQRKPSLKVKARSANRRVLILEYLSKNKKATITEIAQNIPQVSTKTIQRELNKLVQEGLIKKEGERRWTTYSAI